MTDESYVKKQFMIKKLQKYDEQYELFASQQDIDDIDLKIILDGFHSTECEMKWNNSKVRSAGNRIIFEKEAHPEILFEKYFKFKIENNINLQRLFSTVKNAARRTSKFMI